MVVRELCVGSDFKTCEVWNDTKTSQAHSYDTKCYQDLPEVPTTNDRSISGNFIVNKGWRLTESSSIDGSVMMP